MSYIINIETATKNCSVSLANEGKTLLHHEIAELGYSHAEKLHVFIGSLIQEAGISFQDLKAIAVSKGPGSYTGLRIGVSTAKGFCYALGIPLIALDTLAILAQQVQVNSGLIIPMLDARRMEVYSAVFDANHEKIGKVQAEILTIESYATANESIYIVGDCQEKCQTVLTHSHVNFIAAIQYPSAKDMSSLSYSKFMSQQFEDVAYFEPFYLKDFLLTKKS